MKDWTGNSHSTFTTLGASNHTDHERESNDYYATDPKAIDLLCAVEKFTPWVWEPACGEGHLSERLRAHGYNVKSTDLIDRGYGLSGVDFLKEYVRWKGDIITNPPYRYAKEFVEHALECVPEGFKVAMFLKLTFLEGKSRKELFLTAPPKTVYVLSSRLKCAMNGEFDKTGSSATAYAWYVWEKGYTGDTVVKWI